MTKRQTNRRDIGFGKQKKIRHQNFLTMTFAYSPAAGTLLNGRHRRSNVSGKMIHSPLDKAFQPLEILANRQNPQIQ
jgi:hypothetical protein